MNRYLVDGAMSLVIGEPLGDPVQDVVEELMRAEDKFPGFHSAHEGISVIREEFEELWDHVKADTAYSEQAYKEAMQLSAMALRFMLMVRERQATGRHQEKGTR